MPPLTYQTAGESHGPAMIALVNGLPADLELDVEFINFELRRRQGGYGRGARQRIESDSITWLSGVRRVADVPLEKGASGPSAAQAPTSPERYQTTGAPLAMLIANRDHRLHDPQQTPPVTRPRPGHADLAGALKWLTTDCRSTLERASARETAARTAAGAVARCLLRQFDIVTFGFVRGMLDATTSVQPARESLADLIALRSESEVYCPDPAISERIIAHIHKAKTDKDTVGGLAEVHVFGVPPGLGTCANWEQRLDARLAAAVMGIQAFKAVEIGLGKDCAFRSGSQVHDAITFDAARTGEAHFGFLRPSNNAGGIEGGMSNGMPVVVRGTMKPISTLLRGMPSVDLNTRAAEHSAYERSDVCALPAASVVMENVVAFEIARAFLEKFAGDTMQEVRAAHEAYLRAARSLAGGSHPSAVLNADADQSEA
jgi:chorismate synthase